MTIERNQDKSSDSSAQVHARPRGGLKRRLLIAFLLVALVPLIVVSAVSYTTAKKSLRDAAFESLTAAVDERVAFVNNWFRYRLIDLESQATNISNAQLLSDLHDAYTAGDDDLSEFVTSNRWRVITDEQSDGLMTFRQLYEYYDVFLIDMTGNILFSATQECDLGINLFDGPLAESRFAAACRETLKTGHPAFSDVEYYSPLDNIIAGFLAEVIFDEDGEKIGIFAIQITPRQIEYLVQSTFGRRADFHTYIIGMSSEGNGVTLRTESHTIGLTTACTLHSDSEADDASDYLNRRVDTEQTRLWVEEYVEDSADLQDTEDHEEEAFTYAGPNSEYVLGIHRNVVIAGVDWGVIAEIPERVAFAPVQRLQNLVLGLLLTTGVLVVIIASIIARRIVQPITQLSEAAKRIAQGNLNQNIDTTATGEIGRLAECFSSMVSSLRESFAELTSQKHALDEHAIVSITDTSGNIIYANDRFCEISGYTRDQIIGQNHRILRSDEHSHEFYHDLWKTLVQGRIWSGEMKNRSKDGKYYWVNATMVPFKDDAGKITQYVAIRTDITDRKAYETKQQLAAEETLNALQHERIAAFELKRAMAKVEEQASTDKLTGLPNRLVFLHRLSQMMKQSRRESRRFAVLFFDFDRFKVVNDGLGHDIGDALLCDIADIFRRELRETDTVARFGGDEFVVLLGNLANWEDAALKAERLLNAFAEPHTIGDHLIVSTASIGLVTNKRAYRRPADMIRDADAAMYQAKDNGKAQVVVFDGEMHEKALDRITLEVDLRNAVSEEQLRLVYQPIVDLESGELTGFEALVRWDHPERGVVSPVDFIPIAEDTGLIIEIGKWVLNTAAAQIADWNHRFGTDHMLTMNVNVSKRQLLDPTFLDIALACQHQYDLHSMELKLEVTESMIADDRSDVVLLLHKLREHGFPIVMDDFGTGVSSLSTLHEYPIDVLKIDQAFIRVLDRDRSLLAVVSSITTLADNLGIETVAEGVETADIVGALQSIDCTWGQGYYFAMPLTQEDAEQYILAQQVKSEAA